MATTPPTITSAPTPAPQRGEKSTFSARVDTFVTWLIAAVTQFGAVATNVYNNAIDAFNSATASANSATQASSSASASALSANAAEVSAGAALITSGGTATSTTANTLAYGTFTITVQTGKGFVLGMSVKVASTASPTNWLHGDVTAYTTGTGVLVINATRVNGSAAVSAWTVSVSAPAAASDLGYLHVRDEKASGTGGGTSVAADITQTRTLNTTVTNTMSGASLASNQVTLPAGTYRASIRVPAFNLAGAIASKAFLYNVTDASYTLIGSSTSVSQVGVSADSLVSGQFTITVAKTFSIRHYTAGAQGSGLGNATSTGQIEIFTAAEFWRIA